MDELQELHKFERAANDLLRMKIDLNDPDSVSIALGLAKRARRESSSLVRALAQQRDERRAQPEPRQ